MPCRAVAGRATPGPHLNHALPGPTQPIHAVSRLAKPFQTRPNHAEPDPALPKLVTSPYFWNTAQHTAHRQRPLPRYACRSLVPHFGQFQYLYPLILPPLKVHTMPNLAVPGLAIPCQDGPCPAEPKHAEQRRAMPCPAEPNRTPPQPAVPCRTRPDRTLTHQAVPRPTTPCLALPERTTPKLAEPELA
jgi:hypothetical protein